MKTTRMMTNLRSKKLKKLIRVDLRLLNKVSPNKTHFSRSHSSRQLLPSSRNQWIRSLKKLSMILKRRVSMTICKIVNNSPCMMRQLSHVTR